jgi:hypothetical protein
MLLAAGLSFSLLAWLANLLGARSSARSPRIDSSRRYDRHFAGRGEHGISPRRRGRHFLPGPVFFVLMGMRTDLQSFWSPARRSDLLALTKSPPSPASRSAGSASSAAVSIGSRSESG